MSYVKNGTPIGGTALSDATPAALGTAAAGVSTSASRADHVHAAPAAAGITDVSATGLSLVTAASAAAARTAIGAETAGAAAAVTTTSIGAVPTSRTVAGAALSGDVSAATILAALLAARTDTIPLTATPGRWTLTPGSGASTASIDTAAQSLDLVVAAAAASNSYATVVPDSAKIPDSWSFAMRARIKTFTATGVGRVCYARMGLRFASGARLYLSAYDGTVTGGVEILILNGTGTSSPRAYTVSAGAVPLDGTGWLEIELRGGVASFRVGTGVGTAAPLAGAWKLMGTYAIPASDCAVAAQPGGWAALQDFTLQAVTDNTSAGAFTVKWDSVSLRSTAGLL